MMEDEYFTKVDVLEFQQVVLREEVILYWKYFFLNKQVNEQDDVIGTVDIVTDHVSIGYLNTT